jgi:hypothetical protein
MLCDRDYEPEHSEIVAGCQFPYDDKIADNFQVFSWNQFTFNKHVLLI